MADYVSSPIAVDPDELKARAYDYLRAAIPGWEPADGNLDAWLIEAVAELAAQVAEAASDATVAIFRWFGANLVDVPPIDPSAASVTTAWTMQDVAGYTIPAGTTIGWTSTRGALVGFQTAEDVVIASGSDAATGVLVVAVTEGADANGLTGTAQLVDGLDFVASVIAEDVTTGGTDGETDDAYLNRLAEELRLMAPRPIVPEDFATLARRVAGVDRAAALNGYDVAVNAATWDELDSSTWEERTITVALRDAAGQPVSGTAKTAVDSLLQSMREVNFVVKVADPDYTTVDVTFTATAWPDWDVATVQAQAEDAVARYLDPAAWGQPTYGETRRWVNQPTVRYLEVAQALQEVEGLRFVDSLTINGGTADVAMTGVAPLPQAGTITGTVS